MAHSSPNTNEIMENRTEFDLDAAIGRWRGTLSPAPQFRREDVQELESHLRDGVAMWRAKGLSEEEAFLIASRRLGSAPLLQPEFAKVNGKEVWLDRLLWVAVGVQSWWVLSAISRLLAETAVIGGLTGLGYRFSITGLTGGRVWAVGIIPAALLSLVQISVLVLAVWGSWRLVRRRQASLSLFAGRFLRRPFFIGLVVVAGSVLLVRSLGVVEQLFLSRWFPQDQFGLLAMSFSMANAVVSPATVLVLAALTVFLARRRLRLRTNE